MQDRRGKSVRVSSRFLACLATLLFTVGSVHATDEFPYPTPEGYLRILSWNIEFLGERTPPRTQEQHNAIASRMLTFDAAVMALQEIADQSVLEYIRGRMGANWRIFFPEGGHETTLMYDTNKVELLQGEMWDDLRNAPYADGPHCFQPSPAVTGVFRSVHGTNPQPFRVICVAIRWGWTTPEDDIKKNEGRALRRKIVELLNTPGEPREIFLIGDMNGDPDNIDTSMWGPHPTLAEGYTLLRLPKENGNGTTVVPPVWEMGIDHCYVTHEAKDFLAKPSAFVIREEYYGEDWQQFEETYSDHNPIFTDYRYHDVPPARAAYWELYDTASGIGR